ncbi:MAG: hypothetical protein QXY87_11215 [Saccharolobus sp.]|uniref:hypothetical protein n=1 Tax=Saccharolobus TaxID=2100760 RepID=UPI001F0E36C8|nr:hypothetical protein [Saccharolobus shibatae]MCH4816185.1 hypothetical protein [Saccharolobus shibatae]
MREQSTIQPVILPQKSPVNEIKGGVGTPYIIYDVKRDKHWLLFTGWIDPMGLKREGFVMQIDRSLNVDYTTIKKILPYNFPSQVNYSNNAVRGFYNEARDEFYVTSTHGNDVYLFLFDPEWKLKGYKLLNKDLKKDSGFPIRPTGAYRNLHDAFAVSPNDDSSGVKLFLIRNIDDLEKVTVEDLGEVGVWARSNDVLDLTLIPRFQIFVEIDTISKWALQTFIGPSIDELYLPEDIKNVGMLQGSIMPLLGLDDSFVQVGHPHYTTEPDGKPKLFFASFRDTYTTRLDTGREGYTHEIWAEYVNESIFDPRSYGELRGKFKGRESKWYYAPCANRLILSLNGEAELQLKVDINDEVSDSVKLKPGVNVIERPTTWFRIVSSNEVKVTIKVLN